MTDVKIEGFSDVIVIKSISFSKEEGDNHFPNNKRLQHHPVLSFIGKACPLFCILPIQTIAYVSYQTPVKFLADH